MKIVEIKTYNKTFTSSFEEIFSLQKSGLYLLELAASAKSWWQNTSTGRSFFQKDSLTIQVNGQSIVLLSKKKKLLADDLWNGNILKGNDAVTYAVFPFSKGDVAVSFVIHGAPFITRLKIYEISEERIELNNLMPSKRDRVPWLTIIAPEKSFMHSLSIVAQANVFKSDDDDLQIWMNGEKQKNPNTKAHREWYWCGKVLRGKTLEFKQEFREAQQHFFQLWADGAPTVKRIVCTFKNAVLPKRIPSVDTPAWTGDFRDDLDQMILARAIFGEGRSLSEIGRVAIGWVIRNRVEDPRWGDTYHDVILQPEHFSAFNRSDSNRRIVENPLLDLSERKAWVECFGIAGKILNGEMSDPTKGANHYHARKIDPEWAKKMDLVLRVQNTSFYRDRLYRKRSGVSLTVLAAMILVSASVSAFALSQSELKYQSYVYDEFAHFKHHLGGGHVAIYDGCGTECELVRIFDEKSGEMKSQFIYGVGYVWSPDRTRVVAFHSFDSGMTIGDRFGNALFEDSDLYMNNSSDVSPYAEWSSDGTKLVIIVLSESASSVPLYIYQTQGQIRRVVRHYIPRNDSYIMRWDMPHKRVLINETMVPF